METHPRKYSGRNVPPVLSKMLIVSKGMRGPKSNAFDFTHQRSKLRVELQVVNKLVNLVEHSRAP
jgi:hypothetical protein